MPFNYRRALAIVLGCLTLSACSFPGGGYAATTPNPTDYVMTLSALQTKAVMTATAEGVSGAPTAAPIPATGGTPGNQPAVVINDTLCWLGPGPAYETVSAVFKGTQVQLLGRTVLPAWYIVRDPLFQDPCWIQASDVQVDPSLLANLPVYPVPVSGLVTPVPSPAPRLPSATVPPTVVTIMPTPTSPTVVPPTLTPQPPPPATPTTGVVPSATQPAPIPTQPAPTATSGSAGAPTPTP